MGTPSPTIARIPLLAVFTASSAAVFLQVSLTPLMLYLGALALAPRL